MYSSAYVWAKVLNHMEERLGAVTISSWFDDAEVVDLTEENLILYSPSDFRRDLIVRRCTQYIQDALKEIFNSDARLLVFGDEERDAYLNRGKQTSSMDFNPQFTFDNFIVGPSNRMAHSAAIAVSKTPGQVYNPLFLYGPPGVARPICFMPSPIPSAGRIPMPGSFTSRATSSPMSSSPPSRAARISNSAPNTGKRTCSSSTTSSSSPARTPPRRNSSILSTNSMRSTSRSS